MSDSTIRKLENQIRQLINNPQKHYELRQNKALFSQLCSSLDVIEDTEDAIMAYSEQDFGEEDKPSHYLAVYGLLQAIYVQQDAVINLCESLGIKDKVNNYPKLKEIREIRNDTVGHPTKRDQQKGKPVSYHHISQTTLNKSGFTLASYFSDGSQVQFRDIKISELIVEQNRFISTILATLASNLEAEEKAHKEKFRMEKLLEIFPGTSDYHLEKLFEGVIRDDYADFADGMLDLVINMVTKFREAVGRRNMDFYERLQDEYELIEHATTNLRKYYRGDTRVEKSAARIYVIFLKHQIDELKDYAKEIDDEYAE